VPPAGWEAGKTVHMHTQKREERKETPPPHTHTHAWHRAWAAPPLYVPTITPAREGGAVRGRVGPWGGGLGALDSQGWVVNNPRNFHGLWASHQCALPFPRVSSPTPCSPAHTGPLYAKIAGSSAVRRATQ